MVKKDKPKSPGLFDDDFDKLFADVQKSISEIDGVKAPVAVKPVLDKKSAARRPDLAKHEYPNYHWNRDVIAVEFHLDDKKPSIYIEYFLRSLQDCAHFYVWNEMNEGSLLRGWSKLGYAFNPITACLMVDHELHFGMSVSDLAGLVYGLCREDAKLIAMACWNSNPIVLDRIPEVKKLRALMIERIQKGVAEWATTNEDY